jgi:hypothetical protein
MLRAQLEWVSEGQTKDIGRARKTAAALVACAVWINAYHADDASIPGAGTSSRAGAANSASRGDQRRSADKGRHHRSDGLRRAFASAVTRCRTEGGRIER